MNNAYDYYYYNDVKFTGKAVEQSGDVMTILLYIVILIMMVMNVWRN